ncbi:MAG: malto-oligosyltrehalose synthase [Chitinophagaceae bacterium]|nr:malto-oligosyltrehalose synthase [Chitinophagaceae bacterium]
MNMQLPVSTYRIQFNNAFTFKDFEKIIDYLYDLGITTIYASPIFKSSPGSMHGYDVCDPHVINPEIGTLEEFKKIITRLKEKGMTWLQDIVPNHMAFHKDNYRLWDVLERGRNAEYADYFDISREHFNPSLKDKLLVPFFEASFDECLQRNVISLHADETGIYFKYYENHYPLSIESIIIFLKDSILKDEVEELKNANGAGFSEWKAAKEKVFSNLYRDASAKQLLIHSIDAANQDKIKLKELHEQQYYVLASGFHTDNEINYRRFFTVNDLICLRMEDEKIFEDYHKLIFQLCEEGLIQGLRIDHIDGLFDPKSYVLQLRKKVGPDIYIICEKILEQKEQLPKDWELEGTSGYEFLSYTNQLLTSREGGEKLKSFYKDITNHHEDYETLVYNKKLSFLQNYMNGEWDNLIHLIREKHLIPDENISADMLRESLGCFMAAFPVYRVYPESLPLQNEALQMANSAYKKALQINPKLEKELSLIHSLFRNENATEEHLYFVKRLMQFTGPLAAKGVEDTTFYIYNPLISHNEVGDAPCDLGMPLDEFHKKMQERQRFNPYSINTTSTHDTKRGEDARMRLNALAEMPGEWMTLVKKWKAENQILKKTLGAKKAPDDNDEYFLYQSITAAYPESLNADQVIIDRTKQFFIKALREAKVNTTYTETDTDYEEGSLHFIDQILKENSSFNESLKSFLHSLLPVSIQYSLNQTLIKLTAPGIPDTYQGCELWDLSYVDPDNRRPVDYNNRRQLLEELLSLEKADPVSFFKTLQQKAVTGIQKLWLTYKLLQFRKDHAELFLKGDYTPITEADENTNPVFLAFSRTDGNEFVIVILPLHISEYKKGNNKNEITLPFKGNWRNLLTNETVSREKIILNELFPHFPVAVLHACR